MAIKRGVNFYSYQDKQFLGQFGLEECLKATQAVGATGFELMPEETRLGHFPNYTDAEVDNWFYLLDKYKLEPLEFIGFVDSPRRQKPDRPFEELLDQTIRDIKLCQKFKVPYLNVGFGTYQYNELVKKAVPVAADHGVGLIVSFGWDAAGVKPTLEYFIDFIEQTNCKNLGFLMDFNLFTHQFSPTVIEQLIRNGADKSTIDFIINCYKNGWSRDEVVGELTMRIGSERFCRLQNKITYIPDYFAVRHTRPEYALAENRGPCGSMINNYNPSFLKDISKYLIMCWGKCYDMSEECIEINIDYENPIKILKECNWNGYINTMYEGQRNFHDPKAPCSADEVDVVRKHQIMLQRLIDK